MSDATAQPPEPIHLRITSDTAQLKPVRQKVEAFAQSAGFGDVAVGEIGLCLNEAMANVIRHAYHSQTDKPVEVSARVDERGTLHIAIRDWGEGKAPGMLPKDPHDPTKPGGLGLVCLGRLMDKVIFTPQPDGMLMEMLKKKVSG
jgi:anti-sigma regulatory factor (Ser/Thr protein kinase)